MVDLEVNGKKYKVNVDSNVSLLWVLRENLNLVGVKPGCEEGACGSCTVHIDGKPGRSCQIAVGEAEGTAITTIEGLSEDHPLKEAFVKENAPQCGYCSPGQIMTAAALLTREPNPTEEMIDEAMDEVLCRCGTYPRDKAAIKRAVKQGGAK